MAQGMTHRGRCECGAVTFEVRGERFKGSFCHCSQCRRQGGHAQAWIHATIDDVHIVKDDTLAWYRSSPSVERGFCGSCGSSLFARYEPRMLEIAAGSMDTPTDISMTRHIFVGSKGDYYEIEDALPRYEREAPDQ